MSFTLLAMIAAAACSSPPTQAEHLQALLDAREAWGRAIVAGDLEGVLSHWTEDVVIYPATEPAVHGKNAVREYVGRNRAQGIRPRVTTTDVTASAGGDIGYVIGTYVWVNADGDETMPGQYVELWRMTDEGEWKCFLEIHSPLG